ncbi:hypothetical protein HFP15_15650 [Amycolatopsis sp. K13G38]|uniref:Uncharacterized protein n=2 Tax=Amycolatopsis acididurans TaxID=2724524 RepID=A0ABX1J7B4_9PSEU|nr:hypothetical protein [Amycolatopsis acididurans]
MFLAFRGNAVRRLVGLQLAGAVTVLLLVLVSLGEGQSSYLIVPLVAVLLSFAGTLVFTRLFASGVRDQDG